MKIAILADIHGNDTALRAVLKEAKRMKVKRLLILGDLIGYYYRCVEVLKLLKTWRKSMLKGNHEMMLDRVRHRPRLAAVINKKYGSGIDMALRKLRADELKMLTALPFTRLIRLNGLRIRICHGAPWSAEVYIYPNSKKPLLNRCLKGKEDFVFTAHTHRPFVFKKENSVLINVGSVGQARERGGVAQWVLFDPVRRVVNFRTTCYNPDSIIREVKKQDAHCPYLWEVLVRKPEC